MKAQRDYQIGPDDRAWIEATSEPVHPVIEAMESAAVPGNIPILDRESGRVLAVLAFGRRRICEVGTAIGYSTLWMALAQGAGGSIVTIDPDRERTDQARGFWRTAGIAIGRITVVNKKALEAFAEDDPALSGPFDLVFIDAIKGEYEGYLEALIPRLLPGAYVIADNVLWSGRVSGARPADADDESTPALRKFDTAMLHDHRFQTTILPVGDGLLVATYRG
ncbi:MAG TPA: O-methyltransferase [Candidatus Acidoferrum sp.]|nr:O-methyltransferase [Candidatus Acidoferrum sp.]